MTGPLNPDLNPLFSKPINIPSEYWERLKLPLYELSFLGFATTIFKEKKIIDIKGFPFNPNFQTYLIILSYLYIKDRNNIFLPDMWVLPKELKGGLHFFDKSHPLNVMEIFVTSGNSISKIRDACKGLAGTEINFGDFGYDFLLFPEIKVRYIFYEGDEDFPSQITVNFQKNIEHYFHLDVIWAMVNVITKAIVKKIVC